MTAPLRKIGDSAAKDIAIIPMRARSRQQCADRSARCLTRGRDRNKRRVMRLLRSGPCSSAGMKEIHVHDRRFTITCITSGKNAVHKVLGGINAGYHFPRYPVPF